MQNKHRFLFFSLAGLLVALLLSAAGKPVSGVGLAGSRFYESRQNKLISGSEQTSPCMAILLEAANKAGVKGTVGETGDDVYEDGTWMCTVRFIVPETGNPSLYTTSTQLSLTKTSQTSEESCVLTPNEQFKLTTFHGYNAKTAYYKGETRMVNNKPYTYADTTFVWCMHKGGRDYMLQVYTATPSIEKFGPPQDPLPIAEVLWSIAEDRLPLSEAPAEPALPVEPGEVVPGQPEVPTDQTVPTETGGIFGIPLAIILGSLGIPIIGAVAGAVLSLLSAISSAATAAAPIQPPFTRELDRDELADQFNSGLSKEEFILARTRADLSQNLGEEFDKFSPADQANLVEFQQRVHDLIQKKIKDGYYVKNPDVDISIPFLPHVGVMNIANELIDPTPIGMLNNYKGGRCGEYTDWGRTWTKDLLAQTGFRGQDICVSDVEIHWNNIDNHGATEARFPNEIKVVVDYHQSFQNGKPVLFSEKNWITRNKYRCSNLLMTPEIRYDGVSGNKSALKFDRRISIAENKSNFIEQAKDKPEARAIVREFYDEFLKDSGIKNAPPPPDLKGLVDKLPKDPRH